MKRKRGTAFIFSTHDSKVTSVAPRIVTVEDGKLSEDDHVA
jgi:ABC-type lipoprotein export system ATPase subunit